MDEKTIMFRNVLLAYRIQMIDLSQLRSLCRKHGLDSLPLPPDIWPAHEANPLVPSSSIPFGQTVYGEDAAGAEEAQSPLPRKAG